MNTQHLRFLQVVCVGRLGFTMMGKIRVVTNNRPMHKATVEVQHLHRAL